MNICKPNKEPDNAFFIKDQTDNRFFNCNVEAVQVFYLAGSFFPRLDILSGVLWACQLYSPVHFDI